MVKRKAHGMSREIANGRHDARRSKLLFPPSAPHTAASSSPLAVLLPVLTKDGAHTEREKPC